MGNTLSITTYLREIRLVSINRHVSEPSIWFFSLYIQRFRRVGLMPAQGTIIGTGYNYRTGFGSCPACSKLFTRSRSKKEHTRRRSCTGTQALSTIGATEPPQTCARVDDLIGIDHAGHTETSEADGVFCGRDELGLESSRIIDDENAP